MLIYGVDHFTYQDVINIINGKQKANLDKKSKTQIQNSYQNVQKIVKSDKTVYGINTGFGPLCDVKISEEETALLQHNLIISHAVGVGKPIDKELIIELAKTHDTIVTCEEHSIIGGLGSAVAEVLAEAGTACKLVRVGVQDVFGESGKPAELFAKYKIDADAIVEAATK